MKEIRVLHLVPALFGPKGIMGGAERYALELARNMAEIIPTTLVTFGDENRCESFARLKLDIIANHWHVRGQRTNPIAFSLLPRLRKAHVVHCHQQHVLASSVAALFCRISRRRVFVSDLGGGGWDISSYLSTDRLYDGHLHISEYSRRVFGHTTNTKAHVILGGVDTEKFSPDSRVNRDGTVLFVGRLLPHKGINDLIRALPSDMHLEIIGQPYNPRFFEDLCALAAEKQVTFHHDYEDAALVQAYRKALCIVLPSTYKDMYGQKTKVPELLGQTLLEGMACGTPAICTDVASLPEIVEDGITGLVVPPNSPTELRRKLLWLREHPEQTKKMGESARSHVLKRFTWPAVVRRCLEIYEA